MNQILLWILAMTLINGLLAFAGSLFYFIFKKNLSKILIFLVSFTTGALLGGAFLHFIPESIEELNLIPTILLVALGFFIFLLLEKYLHWHHCHDDHCEKHPYTYLLLWGDGIHNFIDGLIIASSFLISIPFGIVTSILIILHELPQEISDFGVLIYGGFKEREALFYNFLSQLTAVLGGLLGFFFFQSNDIAIYLLPFAAGSFIYIALADLIPEIFKEKDIRKIIINFLIILSGILLLISGKILVG
ncbi:ZIP family metal transporter [Candidatus Pacearchaeota archaeon]|jgi:zinc and cadmium transporter|nr:ZIP family metal transporter [Candidatus Pacearchaeota archaeon]|tara:strand:+ start:46 stop:786 length:741 start_codon:yes stop_codon:yes gene_type:complete